MILTATAEPLTSPPRIRLDVSGLSAGETFLSVVIKRNGVPIRQQPTAGGTAAVAFDLEAPRDVTHTYTAEAQVATYTTTFTESWANLSAWTVSSGTPSVSGGRLTSAVAGISTVSRIGDGTVYTRGRIRMNSPVMTAGGSLWQDEVRLMRSAGNAQYGANSVPVDYGTGAVTAVWDENFLTVTTTAGSFVVPKGVSSFSNTFGASVNASGQSVPGFDIGTPTTVTQTANATASITATDAWLINPVTPSLSVSIDPGPGKWREDGVNVDIDSAQDFTRESTGVELAPVGRQDYVVITQGRRRKKRWSLRLYTPRRQDRDAVDALIDDNGPLLLLSPPSFGWDLPDGFYAVGETSESRVFQPLQHADRYITLPLTPISSPIVRQGATWTWGGVLLRYATWADVKAANPTWIDLIAGPQ